MFTTRASMVRKARRDPKALSYAEEKILRAARDLPFFTAEDITRLLGSHGSHGSYYRALLKTLSVSTAERKTEYLYRFVMPQSAGNSQKIQIPPNLVVKSQAIDIVEVI